MRIGIDATGIWASNEGAPSGIVNYTVQITRNLLKVDQENEYVVYFRNGVPEEFKELSGRASFKVLKSRNRKLLQQISLPLAIRASRIQVMFFPFNSASLFCPCRSVVTIHDLHPFTVPDRFAIVHGAHNHQSSLKSVVNKLYWKNILRLSCRRMTRVIAVSNVTKRDIESIFHAPPEKIDVVHEGVDLEAFSFNGNGKNASAFLREYNLPPLYILCVGTHGYKNVEGSIKAFQIVKRQSPDPLKLVIAGNKRSLGEDTYQMVREMGLEQDVIFTDFFPDEDLKYLYRYSNLLLFPSFYEGFGLPILEAFACGTPVVTSKAGALPEVAGDAAILVDPTETQGIADAVLTMMNDQDFREKKRQLGLQRAKQFSWELAARETLKVVETAGMG